MIATAKRAPRPMRPFAVLFGVAVLLFLARDTDAVRSAQDAGTRALVPLQSAAASVGRTASSLFSTIDEIDRLRAENARLRALADSLGVENTALRERLVAAEQAAKLQQVATTLTFETVPAQVIGRDPTGILRLLTLDVGGDQGVAVGHVVVADRGLVGRVTQVGATYSRVVLITDSSSSIVATVQSSRATGIVRGMFGDTLVLEWILQSEGVSPGDVVVTAGLALSSELRSLYPKGLLIGTVVDVQKADVLAYQRGVVRPAVDLRRLERVLVVRTN